MKNMRTVRSAAAFFGVAAAAALAIAAGVTHVGAQPPAEGTVLAGQKFKNIKVLKQLPADKLIPVMHEWNDALGVKCDFCHVKDRSSDEKPTKNAARTMVNLTKDLNKRYKFLHDQASCYMCHHGKPEPEFHPGAEGGREHEGGR